MSKSKDCGRLRNRIWDVYQLMIEDESIAVMNSFQRQARRDSNGHCRLQAALEVPDATDDGRKRSKTREWSMGYGTQIDTSEHAFGEKKTLGLRTDHRAMRRSTNHTGISSSRFCV
jgi:hypothetical protein